MLWLGLHAYKMQTFLRSRGDNTFGSVWLSVCLFGFVIPTLCTTSWAQDYLVHHRPALCTTNLRCVPWCTRRAYVDMSVRSIMIDNVHANQGSRCNSVLTYTLVVHNVALCRLGGAHNDFARLLSNFFMVYNAVLSVSVSALPFTITSPRSLSVSVISCCFDNLPQSIGNTFIWRAHLSGRKRYNYRSLCTS